MSTPSRFLCSICAEPSLQICAWCTKDICTSHRCGRCRRCSDCCPCEQPLTSEPVLPPNDPPRT